MLRPSALAFAGSSGDSIFLSKQANMTILEQGRCHENSFSHSPIALLMPDAARRTRTFMNLKSNQENKHNPTVLTIILDTDHSDCLITLWPNAFERSPREHGGMTNH